MNRWISKIEIFCAHPLPKSQLQQIEMPVTEGEFSTVTVLKKYMTHGRWLLYSENCVARQSWSDSLDNFISVAQKIAFGITVMRISELVFWLVCVCVRACFVLT